MEAIKEVKMIEFFGDPSKAVKIRSSLDPPFEHDLINFLKEHSDVFAWETSDMQGISPEVMVHRLNVHPEARSIKQKKRTFGTDRNRIIKEEVEKLLKVKYIPPVQYPEWLTNVVLVPKSNEKWRMCIDFTDLNRACPKDSFPLSRIDAMIDSTSGCELMSFLDAFQGYNQIECFEILKKFGMKLNPSKCTFGVRGGKFLGFMVSQRGIEANPEKIEAIIKMQSPNTAKEVLPDPNVSGQMVKWSIELSEHDGSSTSLGSGAGIIVETPQGDRLQYAIKFNFAASNNETEYEALIAGEKLALAAGAIHLKAHSDFQLVVNQIRGEYEAKGSKMTKGGSTCQTSQLIKHLEEPEHNFLESGTLRSGGHKEEVLTGVTLPSWKDGLEAYLKTGTLLQDPKEARAVQVRVGRFTLIGGELYKRGFSQSYLKCISQDKVEYVLREIHEGSYGNHSGGRALASKALRQGCFWHTMRKDAMDLVRKCKKCQEHANITHLPVAPLQPIQSPCPFDQWGMDIVGNSLEHQDSGNI
ncbi:UNVERIFIED_CONTAM: Transposon Ty3-G Gag-Pol polyprotein [Sesamum latifolium]|uniref:Transposon Ty3-G Gag-Pol polyprotein n=1 Tax=Sesamum latifolium TaxID=2727402 RepID=A0AAW2S479_9LAMI